VERRRTEAAAVELNYGGGVLVWRLTGGGLDVGDKLEGNKAVQLITLARVEVVGKMGPHGRPRRRQRGRWRRRCSGDKRR
jgi:hypothetical protein